MARLTLTLAALAPGAALDNVAPIAVGRVVRIPPKVGVGAFSLQ